MAETTVRKVSCPLAVNARYAPPPARVTNRSTRSTIDGLPAGAAGRGRAANGFPTSRRPGGGVFQVFGDIERPGRFRGGLLLSQEVGGVGVDDQKFPRFRSRLCRRRGDGHLLVRLVLRAPGGDIAGLFRKRELR